jgi:hypothetical protein
MHTAYEESWQVLISLLPGDWEPEAVRAGAVQRLRGFANASDLLRTLLLHVGRGYSLRETVVRAKASGLAAVSDVALLKRLKSAAPWWRSLCVGLLAENGMTVPQPPRGWVFRVVDGTVVREPGPTGSSWRIHYSLRLPDLACDYFEITPARAAGGGENLARIPARPGDCLLADRGFCHTAGIQATLAQGADVVVRLNTGNLPLVTVAGERFDLLRWLEPLQAAGQTAQGEVCLAGAQPPVRVRLCAVRKTEYGIQRALAQLRRQASKQGSQPKPETLECAKFVLVVTTLPGDLFSLAQVLEWYRLRWQIELAFKRLKSLAQLGHLPKHDPQSVHGWLYGKLLLGLLTHKLIRIGRDISPWGCLLPQA